MKVNKHELRSMSKTCSGAIAVKQPAVRQVQFTHYRISWLRRWWSSLFLNEFIVSHCTTEDGSLFHSLTTSLVKKNLVQSSWTCLLLSFIPLVLVRDVLSIENILLASTFVNPLSILKHSIIFPRSRRFSRENRCNCANLSSYDLLRKDVIIFVALR